MVSGINTAASGMIAQQYSIDVISNNLANVNTPGFKELIPVFKNISNIDLKDKNKDADSINNQGNIIGSLSTGSTLDSTIIDLQQGAMKKTDNKLDFAINGKGFFVIGTENGECYTRNGNFTVNEEGALVTKDGLPVLNEKGAAITIDTSNDKLENINVMEDGTILLNKEVVDKFKIVEFEKPTDLTTIGNALFKKANEDVTPKDSENSKINQGFIEGSNSNVIGTMINTISATRTYETLSKVVKASESTLSKAVNDVGRLKE